MRKFLAENLQAVIADSAGSVEKFSVPFGRDMDFHDFFRNFGNRVTACSDDFHGLERENLGVIKERSYSNNPT